MAGYEETKKTTVDIPNGVADRMVASDTAKCASCAGCCSHCQLRCELAMNELDTVLCAYVSRVSCDTPTVLFSWSEWCCVALRLLLDASRRYSIAKRLSRSKLGESTESRGMRNQTKITTDGGTHAKDVEHVLMRRQGGARAMQR